MIATSRQSANRAIMPTIRERLRNACPAYAFLTGPLWFHFHQHSPGAFSLVREFLKKGTPRHILHRTCQDSARQSTNVQIFDCNKAVSIDKPATQIVMKSCALISEIPLRLKSQFPSFGSAFTGLLSAGDTTTAAAQNRRRMILVTGILNCRSVGQYSEGFQAHIDSDCFCRLHQRLTIRDDRETDIPLIEISLNRDGFDVSVDRSMQLNLDLRAALDVKPPIGEQPTSVAVSERDTAITPNWFEAREPRFVSAFDASKKCHVSVINSPQHFLAARKIRETNQSFGTHCFQLIRLFVVRNGLATDIPCTASLFKSTVVQITSFAKLRIKKVALLCRRIEAIFVCEPHELPFSILSVIPSVANAHFG